MSRDYAKARDASSMNAKAHTEAAESLLKAGHPGFAIAHAILGFEEAAKAVYCSMVHAGYLNDKNIESVFRDHNPKAFLYSEIFEADLSIESKANGFEISVHKENPVQRIKGSVKGKVALAELKRQKNLKERGLYVGHTGATLSTPQKNFERASPDGGQRIQREVRCITRFPRDAFIVRQRFLSPRHENRNQGVSHSAQGPRRWRGRDFVGGMGVGALSGRAPSHLQGINPVDPRISGLRMRILKKKERCPPLRAG